MNIRIILQFRYAIEDAINMLAKLGGKYQALPSLGEWEEITRRLEQTSPADVVESIVDDGNYMSMSHKRIYLMAFGRVLDCETFVGYIYADGKRVQYKNGLNDKLESTPGINAEEYIEKVMQVSRIINESIRAMRADLEVIFAESTTDAQITQQSSSAHATTIPADEQGEQLNDTPEQHDTSTGQQRPEDVRCLFASDRDCKTFFDVRGLHNPSWWAHRADTYINDKKLTTEYGDKNRLWGQIMKEHPNTGNSAKDPRQTFTRTLNNLGHKTK